MERNPESPTWLGDDPILDTEDSPDRLGRADFADSAARLLNNVRVSGNSSVVALIGAWGSGKSSMLNMIRSRLDTHSTVDRAAWIVVDFNPWYYSDLASLQVGFFRELTAALPSERSWKSIRSKISSIGQATAPLASVFAGLGLDPSQALSAVSKMIGGDQSLSAIQRSTDDALRLMNRPVLMVLDDLDRLSPDELLLVFKLLRLTGRLHNVHYLISYDEDTLLDALTRTGLVGTNDPRRAVDYLEKMVQIRLDLPPLRDRQIETWLNVAIDQLAARVGLDTVAQPLRRFSQAYYSLMRRRLDTPRSIGRFVSQAEAFLPKDARDFDLEDYLILTWIRTAEPLLYAMLRVERASLIGGRSASMGAMLRAMDSKISKEPWVRRLNEAHIAVEHHDDVADVLSALFPKFNQEWNESSRTYGNSDAPAPRVGNPDYFDRYFHFGVPSDDLADGLVFAAYAQISNGTPGHELDLVHSQFPAKAGLIIPKLETANEADPSGSLALVGWLADQDLAVPESTDTFNDHRRLRVFGARVFLGLPLSDVHVAVETVAAKSGGLPILSDWLQYANDPRAHYRLSDEQKTSFAEADLRFLVHVRALFESQRATSPIDIDEHIWNLIGDWYRIDVEGVRTWIAALFLTGEWLPLDVVARLVITGVTDGVPDAPLMLSGLDFEALDNIVGLDFLYAALDQEIEVASAPPWRDHSVEATPESRRQYALQLLRERRGSVQQ
ncbi:KAP family P-loop NTPase fold protein [Cryobacterium arcticum]|uniref:KAP NTPase domain-containing protein n=1 Tax=Cryobacterium arcticum TaxID=670052 RepID=A0A1B1BK92_9MICO|nr:P-loop NTPase fold protein [Cryobacterium arcticum]ANP73037.1 hypothetical protein PA27867_2085 [Cryobacterium arcticum]